MDSTMDTSSGSSATDINPYTQPITLLGSDGTPMNITLPDIDAYVKYGVRITINYSSQIGACVVLLVVLLLLTRKEKRNSAIFYLNTSALASNAIRNLLQCIYFTGPFYEFYAYFTGDYSAVPRSQFGASIAGIVLGFIVVLCLEASLVLQVRAVCVTMRDLHKLILTILSAVVALTAIGFRMALMIQNSRAVVNLNTFIDYQWLAATNNYVTTGSICFFSAVFVSKLGIALNERRKLHLKQFGPMQVIFIMGCQTLFIPAIFSILQNFTQVPELGSQVLTLTALFLPLSSIWAAASVSYNKRTPLPTSNATSTPSYNARHVPSSSGESSKDGRSGTSSDNGKKSIFKSYLTGSNGFTDRKLTPDLESGGRTTVGGGSKSMSKSSGESMVKPYQGVATSEAKITHSPVKDEMKEAMDEDDGDGGLENELRIHMGRSFGVEEGRMR